MGGEADGVVQVGAGQHQCCDTTGNGRNGDLADPTAWDGGKRLGDGLCGHVECRRPAPEAALYGDAFEQFRGHCSAPGLA